MVLSVALSVYLIVSLAPVQSRGRFSPKSYWRHCFHLQSQCTITHLFVLLPLAFIILTTVRFRSPWTRLNYASKKEKALENTFSEHLRHTQRGSSEKCTCKSEWAKRKECFKEFVNLQLGQKAENGTILAKTVKLWKFC